jgi:hypothetical protein
VNKGVLQFVFARNANNELIYYQTYPLAALPVVKAWFAGNATRELGLDQHVFQIAGDLHALADTNDAGVHLVWRNANNELIHYYFNPSGFRYAENVTVGWPHVGSTFNIVDGLTAVLGPDGNSQHVFGKNANGELIHYYLQGGRWTAEDLTLYQFAGPYIFN